MRFDGFDAGDGTGAEAVHKRVDEFAPCGLGGLFRASSECGIAELLVAQSCRAAGEKQNAFDAFGKIGAFELGAHERPEVFETSAGAAECDGDDFGSGIGAAQFDFEAANASFVGGELVRKVFEDETRCGFDGFPLIGGAFEEERGLQRRGRRNGIEPLGRDSEGFVQAIEDFEAETGSERSTRERENVLDAGDSEFVKAELRGFIEMKSSDGQRRERFALAAAGDGRKGERAEASHGPSARKVRRGSDANAEAEFAEATRGRADDAGFSFVDDFRACGIDEDSIWKIGRDEGREFEQAAGERVEGGRVAIGAVRFGVKCDIRWEE